MQRRYFELVAAGVFAFASFMHLLRIVSGWKVQVGSNEIPFSISWAGAIGAAALAVWGFASASRIGR